MFPATFEYHRAQSVKEALSLLKRLGDGAKLLSGGHSLIPMMKLRLAQPSHLIDIGGVRELSQISEEGNKILIGATVTHSEIASSPLIKQKLGLLADCAAEIGDVQVRNKGTIGGSIAHADPAADYPASILAFDATIVTLGPKGERQIPASKFFVDMMTTALEPSEIVREIQIPVKQGKIGSAYVKFAQK